MDILYLAFVTLGAFRCVLTIFSIRSNGTSCLAVSHLHLTSLIHVLSFSKKNFPSSDRLDYPFLIGFKGSRTTIHSPEDLRSATGKNGKDGPRWNKSHWVRVKSFLAQKSFSSASLTSTCPQNSLPGSTTIAPPRSDGPPN